MIATPRRPEITEIPEYYCRYVDQVNGDDLLEILQRQQATVEGLFRGLPANKWDYAYDTGKWNLKEVLLHVIDTERIFAYRALRISRKDKTPLAGFDQDDYVPNSNTPLRTPASLLEEYRAVRQATFTLFQSFNDDALSQEGIASDCTFTVRALGYIICGHEMHHSRIVRERYL